MISALLQKAGKLSQEIGQKGESGDEEKPREREIMRKQKLKAMRIAHGIRGSGQG